MRARVRVLSVTMATPTCTQRSIAKILNSARGANILDGDDSEDVQNLIYDYFASTEPARENDSSDSSEEESEKDDNDGGEAEDAMIEGDSDHDHTDLEDDTDDEALVNSEQIAIIVDSNLQLNQDDELTKIRKFDCRCKTRFQPCNSSDSDAKSPSPTIEPTGCIAQFQEDEIFARRMNMRELTEGEKDMILLGALAATPMNTADVSIKRGHQKVKRQRQRTTYTIDSRIVCRETFKFLYNISQNKLTALLKHYKEHGVTPRVKKSGGRGCNTNSFTPADIERLVLFIQNFAEDHALVLPGRIPGFKRSDIKVLPSAMSKAAIFRHYERVAQARGVRVVKRSSFYHYWKVYCPNIVVGRPKTDLCWQCKQNNDRIRRTVHLSEEERMEILGEQMDHLRNVEREREFYNQQVRDAKATVAAHGIADLSPTLPNSNPISFHYSFDFAQQVHLPSSPLQPGPIYFLVPRKCGIFGVCAEGLPQQMNYLIDEGMSSSKGSNMVISLLHHFFDKYGLGEQTVQLHCDNCSGQNKNKFVMWYLAWRVMRGLHTNISVHFMPAGHTKFAPDWCFGLLKKKFKLSEVHCLNDLCHVVETSTQRRINRAQLVGTEGGDVRVPIYDWHAYFDGWFRPLKGIKSNHHFRFSHTEPGKVFVKPNLDSRETVVELAYSPETVAQRLVNLPEPVPPPGLPEARRQYLHQHIRPYVRDAVQDLVCPRP